jgi:hypothetical protein
VRSNAPSLSVGKPTIASVVTLKSASGSSRRRKVARGISARHVAQHAVVAGLQRDVQVAADGRRLAQRVDELLVDVVDLDRRQAQTGQARESRRPRGRAEGACSRRLRSR